MRVVGPGVNPGFVMDALPVMLTAPCRAVHGIAVERVVDVDLRPLPLQRGVGMTVEAFLLGSPTAPWAMSDCRNPWR